jgi:hypothetical protein
VYCTQTGRALFDGRAQVIHGVARCGGEQAQIAGVFGRATGAQFARARGGVEVLQLDAIGLERRGEEFDVVHGANLMGRWKKIGACL